MSGLEIVDELSEEDEGHMALTETIDAIQNGKIDCITGHAES